MYQFVEPKIVVELRAVDIQIEDLHGEVIRDPRLILEDAGWKVGGWTNSANVHNAVLVRIRTDKAANSTDSGWNQITRLFPIQEGEKEIELGTSEIIRREGLKKVPARPMFESFWSGRPTKRLLVIQHSSSTGLITHRGAKHRSPEKFDSPRTKLKQRKLPKR